MALLRKIIFWSHLAAGVVAGLVIIMMSVTGVLLTYERQLTAWADRIHDASPPPGAARQPLEQFLETAAGHTRARIPGTIVVSADPSAPVQVEQDRGPTLYFNPYTGEFLGEGVQGIRSFFRLMTGWHRWFDAGAEQRSLGRAVTGACNMAFLFLIVSGLYLWLPRRWRWNLFRNLLWFNPNAVSGKARDYNWHHVFGIWSALPLAVVVATAVVISYPWAGDLVYRAYGENPPAGRGPRGMNIEIPERTAGAVPVQLLSLDAVLQRTGDEYPGWRTIRIQAAAGAAVRIEVDRGSGGQPHKRVQLVFDRGSEEILNLESFADRSPAGRMRTIIRFAHTGEILGLPGQTLAGLVSLVAVLMVWTGIALAYRRLVAPLLKR